MGLHTISIGLEITTSLLTATSVNISWRLPEFFLPAVEYSISLTQVNGSGQVLCNLVMDNGSAVTTNDTSMSFTDLEALSTYTVTVNTTFNVSGSIYAGSNNSMDVASDIMFDTPSAGMDTSSFNKQQCS